MDKKDPGYDRYIDEDMLASIKKDPEFAKVLKETDNDDSELEDDSVFEVPVVEEKEDTIKTPDFTDFFESKPKIRKRRGLTKEDIEHKLFKEDEENELESMDINEDVDDAENNEDAVNMDSKSIPQKEEIKTPMDFINKPVVNTSDASEEGTFYEEDEEDVDDETGDDYANNDDNENDDDDYADEDDDDDYADDGDYEEEEDEDDDEEGYQIKTKLDDILFAPPKINQKIKQGIKDSNEETKKDSYMDSFASGLKSKRKNFWDDLKSNSETDSEEILDAEPEEKKMDSQFEFKKNINEQINQETTPFLSFKNTKNKKMSNSNIHFSLSLFFDKLKILGIKKEEAALLLDTFETDFINKLAAILTSVELTAFHLQIIKDMGKFLTNLQEGVTVDNPLLAEFLKAKNVVLHNVSFIKPKTKIKIEQTNYGLLPSNFINKINIPSLDKHLKITRRQYMFRGILKNGKKIEGIVIPIDAVPKGNSNIINLFSRFGYTVHQTDLVYMFLGKDSTGNKSVYLIK